MWGEEEGKGRERTRCSSQKAKSYKESKEPKLFDYIAESNTAPWAGKLGGQGMPAMSWNREGLTQEEP